MKNEIMLFENSDFGSIRTVMIDNDPWFIAKDVAEILGYTNPSRSVQDHCKHVKILKTTSGVVLDIPSRGLQIIPESDLYRLVLRSHLTSAERFQDWVVEEILPAIRKTGSYSSVENILKKVPFMEFDKHSLSVVFDLLKPSENSKLMMVHKLFDKHGADKNLLPQFTEKVKPIFSATKLLEDFGKPMSIRDFNKKMREKGFLELKTRKSRKDGASDKTFLALTSTGLGYGQNDVSPQNPLETQPHYYEETFEELLGILAAVNN